MSPIGYKYDPERVKRENERAFEITRNVYSAAKLGESVHEPDIPHRNYIPKNALADLTENS